MVNKMQNHVNYIEILLKFNFTINSADLIVIPNL